MKLIQKIFTGILLVLATTTVYFSVQQNVEVSAQANQPAQLNCPWYDFLDISGCRGANQSIQGSQASTTAFICGIRNQAGGFVATSGISQAAQLSTICNDLFTYTQGATGEAKLRTGRGAEDAAAQSGNVCTWVQSNLNGANATALNVSPAVVSSANRICNIDRAFNEQIEQDNRANCGLTDIRCFLENLVGSIARGLTGFIAGIVALVATILAFLVSFLLQIFSFIANELLLINPASNQYIGVSRSVFGIFSNLVNLIILFLFVKTGLDFIFNDKKSPDISNFIITVATIAIGVQFSFALAAAIIALSYNIGYIFLQTVSPGSINPFTAFFDAVNGAFNTQASELLNRLTTNFVAFFTGQNTNLDIVGNLLGTAVVQSTRLFLLLVALWIMWLFIVKFAIRAASMFFLLITAPIGFVFLIAQDLDDDIKKFGKDWWSGLINNALVYPIIVIGLAIGARLVVQISAINTGTANFTTDGFNLFETGTYSIIIAPIIQSVLPGVVGLGTLYLIYQWMEDNLKPAAAGITGKIMQFAGRGANLATNLYRRGVNYGAKGAGYIANTGNLASNVAARLLTRQTADGRYVGLGGMGTYLASRVKRMSKEDALKERNKVIQDQRKKTITDIHREGVKRAIKYSNLADEVYRSDGALNLANRYLPFRMNVDKNGNFSVGVNEGSIGAMGYGATASEAKREADILVSDTLRSRFANDENSLALLEKFNSKNGIRTAFSGRTSQEWQSLRRRMGDEDFGKMVASIRTREGQIAATKARGLDGKDALPSPQALVASVADMVDIGELDYNSEDPKIQREVMQRAQQQFDAAGGRMQAYLRAILDDPQKFSSEVKANPQLAAFLQSKLGVEFLINNYNSDEDIDKIKQLYSQATGLLDFSDKELSDLASGETAGIAVHIQDQMRKVERDLAGTSNNFFIDALDGLKQVRKSRAQNQTRQQRVETATGAGRNGDVYTSDEAVDLFTTVQQTERKSLQATIDDLKSRMATSPDLQSRVRAVGGIEKFAKLIRQSGEAQRASFTKIAADSVINAEVREAIDTAVRNETPVVSDTGEFVDQPTLDAIVKTFGLVEQNGQYKVDFDQAALNGTAAAKTFENQIIPELQALVAKAAVEGAGSVTQAMGGDATYTAALGETLKAVLSSSRKTASVASQIDPAAMTTETFAKISTALEQIDPNELKGFTKDIKMTGQTLTTASGATKSDYSLQDVMRRAVLQKDSNQAAYARLAADYVNTNQSQDLARQTAEALTRIQGTANDPQAVQTQTDTVVQSIAKSAPSVKVNIELGQRLVGGYMGNRPRGRGRGRGRNRGGRGGTP